MQEGKKLRLRAPSPAMIVALVALVFAMSGTAVAASKLVKGDSLIKKASLSGNRLKGNTVTGKQIKESSLGKVASATKADTATKAADADMLGGKPPSAYLPTAASGGAVRIMGRDFTKMSTLASTNSFSGVRADALDAVTGISTFATSLQLPQGAKITAIKLYTKSPVASGANILLFVKSDFTTPADPANPDPVHWDASNMVLGSTAVGDGSAILVPSPQIVIDNTKYSYELDWLTLDVTTFFTGVAVEYSM